MGTLRDRAFANTRRAGGAHRATLSVPVSDHDFRGERLHQRLPRGEVGQTCLAVDAVQNRPKACGPTRQSVYACDAALH